MTVGMSPSAAAFTRTSWPTPSSWRKTVPGGPSRPGSTGSGERPRRRRRSASRDSRMAVGLVVADGEGGGGGGGDGGHHRGDDDRRLRVGIAAPVRDEAQRYQQQRTVEEEDQRAENERGHDEQGPDEDGPHQGGEQAERARAPGRGERRLGDRVAVVGLELEVGQGAYQHEHGEGGHRPDRDHPHQGPARRTPLPVTHAGPPHALSAPGPRSSRARPSAFHSADAGQRLRPTVRRSAGRYGGA